MSKKAHITLSLYCLFLTFAVIGLFLFCAVILARIDMYHPNTDDFGNSTQLSEQFTLYIGLNDEETNEQIIIEEDALNYLRGCFHVDNVNAFYEQGKSYILNQEPNTCGKRILIGTEKEISTIHETNTVKDHTPNCTDHNHCDCPTRTTTTSKTTYPQEKSFIFKTKQCIKDSSCACPKYVMYI